MKFTAKHGWLLVGIAVWNFYSYANFTRNLIKGHQRGDEHPDAYYIAHTGLIVINIVIGVVLLWLGIKVLRANRSAETTTTTETPDSLDSRIV